MRKLLFSLALAATTIVPVWGSVVTYEAALSVPLKVVPRVLDGSIEQRVHEVHTNRETGETNVRAYNANLGHLSLYCSTWHSVVFGTKNDCPLVSRNAHKD